MSHPPPYRHGIEVASLILGPALMSVGDLFHPAETWDVAAQVEMVFHSPTRWYGAHLLLLVGLLLLVPGVLAITRLAADRRPKAGYAATVLLLVSVGALSAVFACEMLLGRFVSDGADEKAAIALFQTFQSGPVFGALVPGLLAFFIGTFIAVTALAFPPGPFRWPALIMAVGAVFILGEIILAQVVLSQIGNIVIFVAGVAFARALMSGAESPSPGPAHPESS